MDLQEKLYDITYELVMDLLPEQVGSYMLKAYDIITAEGLDAKDYLIKIVDELRDNFCIILDLEEMTRLSAYDLLPKGKKLLTIKVKMK